MEVENRNQDTNDIEWLEHESKRLELLRNELNKAAKIMRREVASYTENKNNLEIEKQAFQKEVQEFEHYKQTEHAKLNEDQSLLDKKFKILEMGFKQLEADRKMFESQKRAFEYRQKYENDMQSDFEPLNEDTIKGESEKMFFFRGVTHPLALKKRYKELIKIYHPDNLDGDKSILQQINREYEMLKKIINYQKKV